MKMKFLIFLISLISFQVYAAGNNDALLNNEATGYVDTLKSFVSKASETCKPILNKDDEWENTLVSSWLDRNKKYSEAAQFWTDTYLTRIRIRRGITLAQHEEHKINSLINMRGTNITREIIKGDQEEKVVACQDFEHRLSSGELDITEKSPFFQQLEKMAKMYR